MTGNAGNQQPGISICGFDVGSENCYIAVARAGGIEILLNDYSQRSTPSYIGLGDRQRDIGVSAKQKQMMNLKRTFFAVKRLVGRQYNDVVNTESLPFEIVQSTNGEVAVRVNHNTEEMVFTATQLMAMVLTKLRQISEMAVDCVINCPNYFTDGQRRALFDAAQIAGLNPIRILPDMTAIGIYYGFYRVGSAEERPTTTVAFVDCGHTTTQCAVVYFSSKQNLMQVLSSEYATNLGGKHFDEVIGHHFIKTQNLKMNLRSELRLIAEAEKLKKQMSANSNNLPLNIECLYDDRDFQGYMDRTVFEELSRELLVTMEGVFRRALTSATDNYMAMQRTEEKPAEFKIDAVEIVGGTSRIPAIKRIMKEVFGVEASTTLNADEAVARGCALQCAMLSPSFRVARELNICDFAPFTVNCKYWHEKESDSKIHSVNGLFTRGQSIPFVRQLTITCRSLPILFELEYINDANHVAAIGQFKITSNQNLAINNNKMKIRVKLDNSGLISVTSAALLVEEAKPTVDELNTSNENHANDNEEKPMETNEQEKAPNSGDAKESDGTLKENDVEEKEKIKEKEKKPKITAVELDIVTLWIRGKMTDDELSKYREIETNLILADKNYKERIDARNELEEYVYDWRSKLEEGRYDQFIGLADKQPFMNDLMAVEQWLYDDVDNDIQSKSVYQQRLTSMKAKYSNEVLYRESETNARPEVLDRLGKSIQMASKILDSKEEVDDGAKKKLEIQLQEKSKWLEECYSVLNSMPLNVTPHITTKEIKQKMDEIEAVYRPILDDLNRKRIERQRKEEEERRKQEEELKAKETKQTEKSQSEEPMDVEQQSQPQQA